MRECQSAHLADLALHSGREGAPAPAAGTCSHAEEAQLE